MTGKYHEKSTISSYFLRQYEPYIRYSYDRKKPAGGQFGITQDGYQTEVFYRTILDISEPYLEKHHLVLDLGCALGRLSAEYAKRVKHAVGLDNSETMVKTAQQIITSEKTNRIDIPVRTVGNDFVDAYTAGWGIANCDFLVGNAESIPFVDLLFDFVACVNLLDRTLTPRKVIAEIFRILKPGGFLLITSPYDWRKDYTPNESDWITDIKTLFDQSRWNVLYETDGIPSVTKIHNRAISLTFTHMLVLTKTTTPGR